jgi:MYXO-CTERM domain-containing protein
VSGTAGVSGASGNSTAGEGGATGEGGASDGDDAGTGGEDDGGCGCRLRNASGSSHASIALLALAGLGAFRRRRRLLRRPSVGRADPRRQGRCPI